MLGRGVGLVGLIERARERAVGRGAIAAWHQDERSLDGDGAFDAQAAAEIVADEVCRLALGGQFALACDVAYPYDLFVPDDLWGALAWLDECPGWISFRQIVEVAERIDSYLSVMQTDRRTAALAQDCRGELDLLRVLADLCEDVGLPRAAAEARHLHELALQAG